MDILTTTKTAVVGRDPNYGRVLVALGSAGFKLATDKVSLKFGNVTLFSGGKARLTALPRAAAYLRESTSTLITVGLGQGKASWETWTCDITTEYVNSSA